MALAAYRWMMTAPNAPLVRTALDLVLEGKVQLKSFVERHPLDDINRVFAAVHHRDIKRRAVRVPAQ